MKLKFNESVSGQNFSAARGQEIDVPDVAEAQRYIAAGIASAVPESETSLELKAVRKELKALTEQVSDLTDAFAAMKPKDAEDEKDEPKKKTGK